MKKFLLLVAIATLSSVAYGQITYVGESTQGYGVFYGKSWKVIANYIYETSFNNHPFCNSGEDVSYYRVSHGDTIDYFDLDNGFCLTRRLKVPGNPKSVNAIIELPRGMYLSDNNDYMLIGRYFEDSVGNRTRDYNVYERLDTSLVLVQTILSDDVPSFLYILSNGSSVYLIIDKCSIYKFSGTISSNVSEAKADKNGISAYPNPSRDKITLAYQTTTTATSIRICDVNGRLVERIPVNSNSGEYTLNVSNYPEGVYFYEINGKSSSFMVK